MENKDFKDLSKEEQKELYKLGSELFDTFFNSVASWQKHAKENEQLLKINYEHVGKIIHYHLVIENLINAELNHHYNYEEGLLTESKIQFSQKLRMLPKKGKFYNFIIPGIKELNTIRNDIAHNLNYDITKSKTKNIDTLILMMDVPDPKVLSIEKRIEKFTLLCTILFSTSNSEIKNQWNALYEKYPFLEEKLRHL